MSGDIIADKLVGQFDVEVAAYKTEDKDGPGRLGAFQVEIGLSGFGTGLSQTRKVNGPAQLGAAGPNVAMAIDSHKSIIFRRIRTTLAVKGSV